MKTYGLQIALVILIMNCFSQWVKASDWKSFDFSEMRRLIKEKNITYADDLFEIIPAEMKRNPLLVYDSRALGPHVATKTTPRMIFFNRDASLIFTVARNPGPEKIKNGKDQVEVLAFNSVTGRFEIFADAFNGKSIPFENLAKLKNPSRCIKCHDSNPRPLFHNYNGWAGIYGSFGTFGVAAKNSDEYDGLKLFLEKAKSMARYKELDLAGYYEYPAKDVLDKVTGEVKVPAKSVGIAYGIRDLDPKESIATGVLSDYKFATPLVFGMQIESLMMKRLAEKLKSYSDYKTNILPILFYLGDEDPTKFEVVESRCGHPKLRTRKVYETLEKLNSKNKDVLVEAVDLIQEQVKEDSEIRQEAVEKHNILLKEIDHRGIADIPHTAYFPNLAAKNQSPDQASHKQMNAIMEVLFQKLNLKSADISTSRETPTTGIFHLSRLGRMAVDEQYFQNLMRGIRWASAEDIKIYESMSCEDLEAMAVERVQDYFGPQALQLKKSGILYENK